jgi:formylglycine-generating enzyme required for sulfatase activity
MLSEVQRNYWLDQTIHLLQVWSSDSATDRSQIRTNPDFAGLREEPRFVNVAAERKLIPAQTYWLGNREVNRQEYEAFLDDTSYDGEKPNDFEKVRPAESSSPTLDHPAQHLSWYDALMYCNWLSRLEGRTPVYRRAGKEKITVGGEDTEIDKWEVVEEANGYRLPNELEWEYACRAGSETDWNTGSDESLLAAYCQKYPSPSKRAARSGAKLPNAWGMHDMHGNMWEWCWDLYGTEGSLRVDRGGGWDTRAADCRSALRGRPEFRSHDLGFRLALSSESEIPKSPEADSQ